MGTSLSPVLNKLPIVGGIFSSSNSTEIICSLINPTTYLISCILIFFPFIMNFFFHSAAIYDLPILEGYKSLLETLY